MQFGPKLDMHEYSSVRACAETTGSTVYRLTAVVMHHGKGFGSGHYTAYCLNKEAGKCSCITMNSPVKIRLYYTIMNARATSFASALAQCKRGLKASESEKISFDLCLNSVS